MKTLFSSGQILSVLTEAIIIGVIVYPADTILMSIFQKIEVKPSKYSKHPTAHNIWRLPPPKVTSAAKDVLMATRVQRRWRGFVERQRIVRDNRFNLEVPTMLEITPPARYKSHL